MRTNNVKSIRKMLGLSQDFFAKEIGVSQSNICHYEHQRQEVPPEIARKIIEMSGKRGLKISFNDIYQELKDAR